MENKVVITANKIKKVVCVVQHVYRANFNDTYYLDEVVIDLDSLRNDDELFYFDPFMGRSKINDTMVAISFVSDEEFSIVIKKNNEIKTKTTNSFLDIVLTEPFDDSVFLAAHINLRSK